jgi:hypothetical protein
MSTLVKVLLVIFFMLLSVNIALIITFNRRSKKARQAVAERERSIKGLQDKMDNLAR